MSNERPLTSRRPYLLRAMHEWMTDNGQTPHLVVDAGIDGVVVPRQYVRDGKIVLNVSYSATAGLLIKNDFVTFSARFGGTPFDVRLPIAAVLWVAFDPVLDPTLLEVAVFAVAIWGMLLLGSLGSKYITRGLLAAALGRASVDFDDAALTTASTIAVRPPAPGPYETRSLATPELFDIVLIRTECFVIRRSTGEAFALPGVPCRPARQAK